MGDSRDLAPLAHPPGLAVTASRDDGPGPPEPPSSDAVRRLHETEDALRRAEGERTRLAARCEEAERLVHAVNNALSVISAFAGALLDELPAGDPRRESAEEIAEAARRMAALTRDFAAPHR